MKILFVATRLDIGGITPHAISLVAGARDRHDALLVCGVVEKDEGDMSYLAAENGITPIVIPTLAKRIRPWRDLRALVSLSRVIRREKPDVVVSFMFKARLLASIAARLAGIPLIAETLNGTLLEGYFPASLNRLVLFTERLIGRRFVHLVVTTTSSDRDVVVRERLAPPDKVELVTYGFDVGRFQVSGKSESLRDEIGAASSDLLIGTVGRLVPIKGHRYLLDAIAALKTEGWSERVPRFVIVGDGGLRPELVGQVRRLGIDESVAFLGNRNDMPSVYSALDLLVVPSLNEGTCIVAAEAMAAGLPVVGTRVGGVPDLVEQGVTGLLVPPGDAVALAAAIGLLLDDPDTRASFGEAGRKRVVAAFDVDTMVLASLSAYEKHLPAASA